MKHKLIAVALLTVGLSGCSTTALSVSDSVSGVINQHRTTKAPAKDYRLSYLATRSQFINWQLSYGSPRHQCLAGG